MFGNESISLCLAESLFTSPPEGFGELERKGRAQSKWPAEWALGSWSSIAGLSIGEVIGKGGRLSSEPALGVFQESFIFFHGIEWECMPREQTWWKQKISYFSKFARQEELRLNPEAKDHRKRGKLRIGRDVYCGCGWPGRQGLSWSSEDWIPIWDLKSAHSLRLEAFPLEHQFAPFSTWVLTEWPLRPSLSWDSKWHLLEHHVSCMAEKSPRC